MKTISITKTTRILLSTAAVAFCTAGISSSANAQMSNNPWGFKAQNRASIAALIKQVEEEENSSGVSGGSQIPSFANLTCGGGGQASASGNTTCVILNNAVGDIQVGQDAEGDQSANSTVNQETVEAETTDADEILETLEGDG